MLQFLPILLFIAAGTWYFPWKSKIDYLKRDRENNERFLKMVDEFMAQRQKET